ncbi:YhcH/YjgK/YiaL family protein [Desertivirga arenae]|uniref:YhcH/YjgK/YiaL family protein n=1 Tax=Desertivirga arenae TaxID=2810309 RepID=UPI001A97A519|nr:YhcH/YjgK/YiaL family protein [Pedobacter sp. SYSU D00823]
MNSKIKVLQLVAICSLLIFSSCSSTKKTTSWFRKGDWYNGLPLIPYGDIDKKEFESQYQKNRAWWDLAFKYLKETNLETVAPGKYPLDGDNVYVSVTEGPGKKFEAANWESHKKVIDIQYIARGKEKMGMAPVAKATVTKPYDEKRDVANYATEGKFYIAEPGTMYIFFPGDAHKPSIDVDGKPIKKVVVKIRYTE